MYFSGHDFSMNHRNETVFWTINRPLIQKLTLSHRYYEKPFQGEREKSGFLMTTKHFA